MNITYTQNGDYLIPNIVIRMTDEKAVIISTHQVRDIDSLLDHVVIIETA